MYAAFYKVKHYKNQANTLNALSLWARRGGTKCRKNSPQVTVFSQSGEVAMLRAGQALATWQSPGRENLLAYTNKILAPRRLAVRTLAGGGSSPKIFARGGSPSEHSPAVALHPNTRPRWLFTQILARGGSPSEYLPARSPCLASGASLPHACSDLNIGGIFYPPVSRFYLTDRKNGGIIRI